MFLLIIPGRVYPQARPIVPHVCGRDEIDFFVLRTKDAEQFHLATVRPAHRFLQSRAAWSVHAAGRKDQCALDQSPRLTLHPQESPVLLLDQEITPSMVAERRPNALTASYQRRHDLGSAYLTDPAGVAHSFSPEKETQDICV
jgi:hypothetical protein